PDADLAVVWIGAAEADQGLAIGREEGALDRIRVAAEALDATTRGHVPKRDLSARAVETTRRGQRPPIGREREAQDVVAEALDPAQLLASLPIPDRDPARDRPPHGRLVGPWGRIRREQPAIGRDRNAIRRTALVADRVADRLAGAHVPVPDGPVE